MERRWPAGIVFKMENSIMYPAYYYTKLAPYKPPSILKFALYVNADISESVFFDAQLKVQTFLCRTLIDSVLLNDWQRIL